MIVNELKIKNWRNFKSFDVSLQNREFIVGPNASGKSNFLDIFRFLRDIALTDGGGLQRAINERGGMTKIRNLAARRDPEVVIEISLSDSPENASIWRYAIGIGQEPRGKRRAILTFERVWENDRQILSRPDAIDKKDPERLTQTFLEQVNANQGFRLIAEFLQKAAYLHVVPQLLRFADLIQGRVLDKDPFGQGLLKRIASTTERIRQRRLDQIEKALQIAVPQLSKLQYIRDQITGTPHIQALYSHWRLRGAWQREDQFSDGTLRLIGLLWSLLENDGLLLLEEPELSLNDGIVTRLSSLIHRMQSYRGRQVIISTHSGALLSDQGIDGREVVLLVPTKEGTEAQLAAGIDDIRKMLEAGFSVGETVLPRTKPKDIAKLDSIQ